MTHHIDNYMDNTVSQDCVNTTMKKAIAMAMGTINSMYEEKMDHCMLHEEDMHTLKNCMKVITMAMPLIVK